MASKCTTLSADVLPGRNWLAEQVWRHHQRHLSAHLFQHCRRGSKILWTCGHGPPNKEISGHRYNANQASMKEQGYASQYDIWLPSKDSANSLITCSSLSLQAGNLARRNFTHRAHFTIYPIKLAILHFLSQIISSQSISQETVKFSFPIAHLSH